jgi:hypothetical protein
VVGGAESNCSGGSVCEQPVPLRPAVGGSGLVWAEPKMRSRPSDWKPPEEASSCASLSSVRTRSARRGTESARAYLRSSPR